MIFFYVNINKKGGFIMMVNEAKLELALLNAKTYGIDRIDMITRFTNRGLAQEVVTRMDELWDKTKVIAGETIQIGKIIIIKIWEFIEANPNMAIGIAVGAAVGALAHMIPFIGSFLAPITMALGAVIGGVAGHRLDKMNKDQRVSYGLIGIAEDVVSIAKEFFRLFAEIFNALKEYFSD
jgi:outer membrane lipoprotein SlyB